MAHKKTKKTKKRTRPLYADLKKEVARLQAKVAELEAEKAITTEGNVNSSRRIEWRENHIKIQEAMLAHFDERKGQGKHLTRPTLDQLADRTGLSVNTVHKHMQELVFKPDTHVLRVLTDQVLLNIFKATEKNYGSQKLWLQVMENWVPVEQTNLAGQDGGELKTLLVLPDNGRKG
jgi:hypothetical protein